MDYIANRITNCHKAQGAGVRRYPLGILDVSPTLEMLAQVKEPTMELPPGGHWQPLGGNEYLLVMDRQTPPEE
jgi:hypothetical protein